MKKFLLSLLIISTACTNEEPPKESSIDDLADAYLERSIARFPEDKYYLDLPIEDHSLFSSNRLEDLDKWEKFEDSLYAELAKIDESAVSSQANQITYWLLKEELESSIGLRVCKRELWDVNHRWNFYSSWLGVAEFQPVGNDTLRAQAIQRWEKSAEEGQ